MSDQLDKLLAYPAHWTPDIDDDEGEISFIWSLPGNRTLSVKFFPSGSEPVVVYAGGNDVPNQFGIKLGQPIPEPTP